MEEIVVQGMVLKSANYSEYDRRIVLLTKEIGKITVFAHAVRRPGGRYLAMTEPFALGIFTLSPGRSAYSLRKAEVIDYFEGIRRDFEAFLLGEYFLEIADSMTWENNDEFELLKLLYQALKSLLSDTISKRLVRAVFEIKAIAVNGELPPLNERNLLPGTCHAFRFINETPPEKVFSFSLAPAAESELIRIADDYRKRYIGQNFKSLEVMKDI